jgi:hypothetical protein
MYVSDVDNKWSLINDSIETSFYRFSINDSLIMSHFSNSNLLYYSNDLGKSWKDTSIVQKSESILEVNIFGDVITIVTRNMLVYSNDRGNSWINFNENNPDFNIRFRKIYQIKDDIFLASTFNNGILISEDNCKTWKKITDSDETTLSYETTFYIANYGNNIIVPRYNFENTTSEFYYSSNLGRSWELKKFTDNNIYIENLINYKDNIFMTTTNGFMYSTDFGFTWDTHNENIEMDSATIKNTFAFRDLDLNDGKLYLTMNNKVFYLNLSELGIKYTSVERTENRNYLYTYPPYPLPSNKEIKIKAHWDSTIPFTSEDIVIYNLAGIKINTEDKLRILKETNYSGHIIWDTSNEEAGIYIVYIKHGTEMRACKILVE